MEDRLLELQDSMKNKLKPGRYLHTLGVQYTSASLAMRYGCDITQAQIAGLLHDCAKSYSEDEQLKRCRKYDIFITEVEMENPYLLHAKLGAYYAKHKYGIEDEDILNAITYHTTGKVEMTLLEQIVFLADYIEPSRKIIPNLDRIRLVAFENIDYAVFLTMENTLNYLREKGQCIDEKTKLAYGYYKELIQKYEV
jgi:predicted HD superfamily hydrolase involved in NAD metabolism